jgi:hypothetical protein
MDYGEHDRPREGGISARAFRSFRCASPGSKARLPDGIFGPGTELQVTIFERDYMRKPNADGIVNADTYDALDEVAEGLDNIFGPISLA